MKRLFVCHAGAGFPAAAQDEMGIIGVVYVWTGEWLRSPEAVEKKDRNPVMKLRPLFGPEIDVWGDVGCFTEIEQVLQLS